LQHDHDRLKLYLTHRSALVDYATPLAGGSRAQAEDIVQEAYFRFVPQDIHGDAGSAASAAEKPLPYLYRIVRNLAFDWMRRGAAETRRDSSHAVLSDPARVQPSPEEELQHREDLRIVAAVLADLPVPMRQAFELQRFGGLSFQQIGARLGVSPATAHRLAQAALVEIMRRLQGPRRKP
jgi:RNA polymerase sigma-70 factor (ECF subfamily)